MNSQFVTLRFRIDVKTISMVKQIGREANISQKEVVRRCLIAVQPWEIGQVESAYLLDLRRNAKELEVNLHQKELELLQRLSAQAGYSTCLFPARLIRHFFLLGLTKVLSQPELLWKVPVWAYLQPDSVVTGAE